MKYKITFYDETIEPVTINQEQRDVLLQQIEKLSMITIGYNSYAKGSIKTIIAINPPDVSQLPEPNGQPITPEEAKRIRNLYKPPSIETETNS